MMLLRAAWVLPIGRPPLARGWVATDRGRIVAAGGADEALPAGAGPAVDLGDVALLPGLVNAHTHLELSWLRDRVPPAATFTGWIKQLFAARGGRIERPGDDTVTSAAAAAAREARAYGTALVGDVSNSLAALDAIADAGLQALVFHEILGFKAMDAAPVEQAAASRAAVVPPPGVRVTIAPHAPYSVSAELFQAIRAAVDRSGLPITSIHVGESPEEIEMLHAGTGPWPSMLRWIGAWREDWTPPGLGPVEYLDRLGILDARTLVVHGVHLQRPALDRLAAIGAPLVTCPRSNQWVGVGMPAVAAFYEAGVPVAVGTDSLASVADLNLFEELKVMRWLAPQVPASRLLESATRVGAEALGFGDSHGTLAPGKVADILAVRVPAGVRDVEEHLVTKVQAGDVAWAVDVVDAV
ncbi:MAG: amidohydrolase family protein [Vicinamibacterales bacterium]